MLGLYLLYRNILIINTINSIHNLYSIKKNSGMIQLVLGRSSVIIDNRSFASLLPGSRIEGDEAVPASSNFAASYYESYITCAPQPLTSSPWKPI